MKTITFTHTFTFPEDSVIGFANFLGYDSEKMTETPIEYVTRLSREHSLQFTSRWAKELVRLEILKQVNVVRPQIEQAIVKPVEDALQVTVQVNE